jgi:diguanylate cyclase (GGDEF)-like protein
MMRALLALVATALISLPVFADSEPFLLHADSSGAYVNSNVDYFVDTTDRMGVEQISQDAKFSPTAGSMGVPATGHSLWLRVTLQRRPDAPSNWRLEFGSLDTRTVRFFVPDGKGSFTTHASGENISSSDHPFSYSKLLYAIDLPDTRPVTFYLLVGNGHTANIIPLRIWKFEHWVGRALQEYALYGVCFGAMLGLALYNLLLFLRLRDRIFLLYFLLVVSHVLLAANLLGWGSQWLWPERFDILLSRSALLGCVWAIFAILFASALFDEPDISRWIGRVLYGVIGLYSVTLLGILTGHDTYAPMVVQNAPMIWFPLVIGMAAYRAWQRSLPAVYYLVGYGPVLLGIAFLLMAIKGVTPANAFILSFFLGAGAWEAILFSQALAERVNILKREREAAEKHSRESDAELAKIEHMRAYSDELTGLANRESLRKEGEAWLARDIEPLVLVLNIDRFKVINDALGYSVGDAVLVETGRRLAAIRGTTVGRLHSNQFCIICPQADRLDELRHEIVGIFADPLSVNDRSVDVTLSVGVVAHAPPETSMATRMRNAEIALHAGRRSFTGWTHYASDMESAHRTDLALLSAIRHAVDNQELRLYLQPKVHLSDGKINSAEALVRWQHPDRGTVPPSEFIPFAEQSGGIRYLTRWVLQEAMRITRVRRDTGEALQISVNLSMHDLRDPEFVDEMRGLIDTTGANPADIRLEITESVVMDDPTVMLEVMRALNEQGFSLSVDDFGTGYSSLAYLQKMPVTELKIDRAFVSGTRVGGDAEALLDSIIALGHRLGLTVVAEGAETVEEWDLLHTLGCDYLQGWVVAKAMPLIEFDQWVSRNTPFVLHKPGD